MQVTIAKNRTFIPYSASLLLRCFGAKGRSPCAQKRKNVSGVLNHLLSIFKNQQKRLKNECTPVAVCGPWTSRKQVLTTRIPAKKNPESNGPPDR